MSFSASHSIVCNVPQDRVYRVIRASQNWPDIFEPCLRVRIIRESKDFEHIEVMARVNGQVMTWESERRFYPEVFSIQSTVLKPMKLVKSMSTNWCVAPLNNQQCILVLEHDYELCDEVGGQVEGVTTREQAADFVSSAIHGNSTTELGNIKAVVEQIPRGAALSCDRSSAHSIICRAPAESVYSIIRDVANWPKIFESCTAATSVERQGASELVRIEALQEGKTVSWNTQRRYFDEIFRVDFNLPVPMPFLESMKGQWRVVPLGPQRCILIVNRIYRLLSDVRGIRDGIETLSQASALVEKFIGENAQAEMHAIRAFVEGKDQAVTTFKQSYTVPYSPDEVYALLARVAEWPQVLPHCEAVEVLYDDGQNQEFLMTVRTPRGQEVFRSIRRCNEQDLSIFYFQPKPPRVLRSHQGTWVIKSAPNGAEITSQHSITIDPEACLSVFGESEPRVYKKQIIDLITTNSKATVLACAKWLDQRKAEAYV